MAMEDFRVDVVVGKGPGATAIPLEIPPFTLVGATTRAGLLPGPLRDRFGFTAHLEFYDPAELDADRAPLAPGCSASSSPTRAPPRSPSRSRGTPRIANRLLRRVRDYAQVRADGVVTLDGRRTGRSTSTRSTSSGLDRLDRAVLDVLCRRFGGGPVGVVHAGGRRGGGARDRRGGRRAVPGPRRPARPHPARAGRHPGRLGSTSGSPRRRARPSGTAEAADPRSRRGSSTPRRATGRTVTRRAVHAVGSPVRRRLHSILGRAFSAFRRARTPSEVSSFVKDLAGFLPFVLIALVFWFLIVRPAAPPSAGPVDARSPRSASAPR